MASPATVWQAAAGAPPTSTELVAVRVLGARHIAQGVVLTVWPVSRLARRTVLLDVVHGSSMALLSLVSPRHRRVALVSAVLAGAWAAADYVATSRAR